MRWTILGRPRRGAGLAALTLASALAAGGCGSTSGDSPSGLSPEVEAQVQSEMDATVARLREQRPGRAKKFLRSGASRPAGPR